MLMKFCVNCGHPLQQGHKFCSKCGKKLVQNDNDSVKINQCLDNEKVVQDSQNIAETTEQKNDANNGVNELTEFSTYKDLSEDSGKSQNNEIATSNKDKQTMLKWTKIALILLVALVVLGSLVFGIGLSITSEKKVVTNIRKAIENKNSKQLLKYLYCSEEDIEIDEKYAASLIDCINKDEEFKKALFNKLENGINYGGFEVKNKGKTLLVFNKYMLELQPQYLEVESNFENVEVKLDGESIGKTGKEYTAKKLGPFLPRTYKLEYIYEYENELVVLEKKVKLIKGKYKDKGYFDIHFITVDSEVDNLKYSLDGTETNKEITKKDNKIGPLSFGRKGVLVFSKNYSWGKISSKDFSTEEYTIYIENFIIKDSDFLKSASPAIKEFTKSYYAAKNDKDSQKLVNATESCKNIFNDQFFYSNASNFEFKGISVDLQGLWVYYDEEIKKDVFKVRVAAQYTKENKENSEAGNTEGTDNSGEDNNTKETLTLYMIYDESNKKWMVNGYDTSGWVSDNLMEIQ